MNKLFLFAVVILITVMAIPSLLIGQDIYWTQETYGNAKVRKATKAGTLLIDSVAGADVYSRPQAIDVDPANNKVYWAGGAFAGADIFHAGLDLSSQDSLHKNGSSFRGIALDVADGKIYWTSSNLITGPKIRRSNLDGSGDTVLIDFYSFHTASESLSGPKGIALDIPDGKLFWTDDLGNRIRKANLDGSSMQTVVSSGISGPLGIALDLPRGKMYWTEAGPSGQKIQRANLDGSVVTSLITGLAAPEYIELDPDSNAMYWTEAGSGSIRKGTLSGSSPSTVISGLADPAGIVLPHISTPDAITAYPLSGQTTASVSFQVQATGNPMIQTDIAGTVITSPHTFPLGTTTVTCTIPGNADGLTASFTVTVPAFPQIGISPDSLSASLASGDSTSQTLTISNTGTADLTFTISQQRQTAAVLLPKARPGARSTFGHAKPDETPKTYTFDPAMYRPQDHVGGNSAIKKHNPNAVPTAKARTVRKTSSSGLKVLLVNSDDDNSYGSPIQTALLSYPDIGQVDLFDSRSSTPTLSQLQSYDAVVNWTNYTAYDATALGNVLADYVDQGGGVVLGVFDWSAACGYGLGGRILDPTYAPLTATGACDHDATANMVILESSHPIMSGVSAANDYYRDHTSLTYGAELIAKWDDNENMVAIKGRVVGLNSYVGYYSQFTGDIPLILHNSIVYISGLPWLSEDTHSGTVPPGGSENVTVTFNAHGLAKGDYYGNLLVASNDSSNPTVTIPAHLNVFVLPKITLSDTSLNFGNVFVGGSKTDSITISNSGSDTLIVGSISSDNTDFTTGLPSSASMKSHPARTRAAAAGVRAGVQPKMPPQVAGMSWGAGRNWQQFAHPRQTSNVKNNSRMPRLIPRSLPPVIITDPSGDAPYADVVSVRAQVVGDQVQFELDLSTTIDPSVFGGALSLDVDQNPATGCPPSFTSSYGFYGADIGADYEIDFFHLVDSVVALHAGCIESGSPIVAAYPVLIGTNSLNFSVPLADLGNDDGIMNISGIVGIVGFGPTDWFPNAGHGTLAPSLFSLAPGTNQKVLVTFAPGDTGSKTGTLSILSNDQTNGLWTIPMTGNGAVAPVIGVTPDSLSASLNAGDSTTKTLTISNTGGNDLTFHISTQTSLGASMAMKTHFNSIRSPRIPGGKTIGKSIPDPAKKTPLAISAHRSLTISPRIRKQAASGTKVLILGDGATELDAGPVLTAAGFDVTIGATEQNYDGTNPALSSFSAVVVFDGLTYGDGIPTSGQDSLVAFVNRGGGFLFTEWLSFDYYSEGLDNDLLPLLLVPRLDGSTGTDTYTVMQSHPVTSGLPVSFDVNSGYNISSGPPTHGTVLISGSASGNAVTVDHVGLGKVVQYAMAGNFAGLQPFLDSTMQLLFVNSVRWLSTVNWLTEDITSGTIGSGHDTVVTVKFMTNGLGAGDFSTNLLVSSNDPTHPVVTVPVNLHVDAVLPIQLASLTATVTSGNGIALAWTTVSETNNYGFYVERRPQSGTVFTTVSGLIAGAGTSLQVHHYEWTDMNVGPTTYVYRLKQVDLNGHSSYSNEIVVAGVTAVNDESAPKMFQLIQNYPNPFNPTSVIKFSVEKQEYARVTVYNILGEEVAQLFDGMAEPGHYYRLTVDGSSIGSGMYFYRIITDSHTAVKKMLLLK